MFKLCIVADLGVEFWKDIPEYEGLYQASNYGRVKSLSRYYKTGRGGIQLLPERILKASPDTNGYPGVLLCKNGKQKRYSVHRLIAITFLPKFSLEYTQINHKDENKSNNRVENLEWCTAAYNNRFGERLQKVSRVNSKAVLQFSLEGTLLATYQSATEAAKKLNTWQGIISDACRGKQKTAYGFVWKYA